MKVEYNQTSTIIIVLYIVLSVSHTLSQDTCQSWCARNINPWVAEPGSKQKCNWSNCSGCPQCMNGVCKPFCANDGIPWSAGTGRQKCDWESCKGCPQCDVTSPTSNNPPETPTYQPTVRLNLANSDCISICKTIEEPWKVANPESPQKCNWVQCSGCPQCGIVTPKIGGPIGRSNPNSPSSSSPTKLPSIRLSHPTIALNCRATCYTHNLGIPWTARFARRQKCNWPTCRDCAPCPNGISEPSIDPSSSPREKLSNTPSRSRSKSLRPSNKIRDSPPTKKPTESHYPSDEPSPSPTETKHPSLEPSVHPTLTFHPSINPTSLPSKSLQPSKTPSSFPSTSLSPSLSPSSVPSKSSEPSTVPSRKLSNIPSKSPTTVPSKSSLPSFYGSTLPSSSTNPSHILTKNPSKSVQPSMKPTTLPSTSSYPSRSPTAIPSKSLRPTDIPSMFPSIVKTMKPSQSATIDSYRTNQPSYFPTPAPTRSPTVIPSKSLRPTDIPSMFPSIMKTMKPSQSATIDSYQTNQPSYYYYNYYYYYYPTPAPTPVSSGSSSENPTILPSTSLKATIQCATTSPQPSSEPSKSLRPPISLASSYRCPNPGENPLILPSGGIVQIFISQPNNLCTLHQLSSKNGDEFLLFAGRSYDGNEWESVAGKYYDLDFVCGESACTVPIPAIEANSSDVFQLTGFDLSGRNLSNRNVLSRFLEQATFGSTREILDSWGVENLDTPKKLDDSFASWLKEQMTTVKPTIHREYYRERASARVFGSVTHGQPLHPCDKNARWSRFALTEHDVGKDLSISSSDDGGIYFLKIEDIPKTEVNNIDVNDYGQLSIPGSYRICEVEEAVGGKVTLMVDIVDDVPICKELVGGNPAVDFTLDAPPNVFFIPTELKDEFAITNSMIQDDLIHSNKFFGFQCDQLTVDDAWPSFILFSDGDWLQFDPQLVLKENTPENPIPAGGGNIVSLGTLCSNVARTFINADSCYLSDDPTTCGVRDMPSGVGAIVCGSPSEIPNDPLRGDRYGFAVDFRLRPQLQETKWSTWFMIALYSKDQLRQRMAWALSQVLAISPEQIGRSWASEIFLHYYDIFVKHAFGNYRDILKEVSYSVLMSQMLTYEDGRSTAYNLRLYGLVTYPDENYAREVMQLFTIGTVELNIDGSPVLDENGDEIPAYDNSDIISFARAWTGFQRQDNRGNIEAIEDWNRIDPLYVRAEFRDMFPKTNLYDGYIGDGYPLCRDLPSKPFLRKGATYRLLGPREHPELQVEDWDVYNTTKYVPLESGASSLYDALCNPNTPGGDDCNFKSQIVLDRNLPCSGIECQIDTLRVVRFNESIFFEYLPVPCIELAFFNGTKIATFKQQKAMCADPKVPIAMEACCSSDGTMLAYRNCRFISERMTYATAESRCQEIGGQICNFARVDDRKTNECNILGYYWEYLWTNAPCGISIKINKDGAVVIIHQPDGISDDQVPTHLQRGSPNYFSVNWNDGEFPTPANGCGNGACEDIGGMCLCNTIVFDEVVWPTLCSIPLTSEEALSQLHIGSISPDIYDDGMYDPAISIGEVKVYQRSERSGSSMSCDMNTIIEVEFHGERKYFKNMRSIVHVRHVDGSTRKYSFRNSPHLINLLYQYELDAHYETDAVLDHYFHHKNVAPFLAFRFIQRFGISNPSPRYIKTVATAFTEGNYRYSGNGLEYGSRKYGDLGATVAAIILDREARSVVLDADPSHGSLKEPLLKLIAFMRAMEYQSFPDSPEIQVEDVDNRIGQLAHHLPSVFSFFLPEYSLPGHISEASLFSPEAQIHVTPNIVGLINSFISMVKWGFTNCFMGLGPKKGVSCRVDEGNMTVASGNLTFTPTSVNGIDVVDELATLVTAGRLNDNSRRTIADAYNRAPDSASGLRLAQQLITTTAEFNSNHNLIEMKKITENTSPPTQSPILTDSPYKAIVYLLMDGGVDSFNLLVPHSDCQVDSVPKDMYQEYKDVRGEVALAKEVLLPIDASNSAQVCKQFGLHPDLPFLKELYDANDLLFLSNVGVLFEPVNKENYLAKTKTQLFAHNHQKRVVQQVDPLKEVAGTGILGRMADSLTKKGYETGLISVSGEADSLVGEAGISPSITFMKGSGINPFNLRPTSRDMDMLINHLNNETTLTSGVFGKAWNELLVESIATNQKVNDIMMTPDPEEDNDIFPDNYIGRSMSLVARMMKSHETLKKKRDVFYVRYWGFDSHSDVFETLDEKFTEMNDALKSFADEMKVQGLWDNVSLIGVSEFGRTMTANSGKGTDHGWAGNYFLLGGNVNGGRVLGQYPTDLTESGPLNVGRGRLIPTTSWDQIWNGMAQWFDITDEQELDRVIPNRKNFPDFFTKKNLFV